MRLFDLTLLSLATLAGCSQILGVDDYQIDPSLDGRSGGAGGGGSRSDGGKQSVGGDPGTGALPGGGSSQGGSSQGGSSQGGSSQGAMGGAPQGGEPPTPAGGSSGTAGTPPLGEAGSGGEGGSPLEIVPCDSVVCCTNKGGTAESIEMLADGGFEAGLDDTPWVEDSTGDYQAITANDPEDPDAFESHAGDYFAYLSGVQGERTSIYSEDLIIPADAGWLTVSGYRLFQIDKQDELNEDFALIAFYDLDEADPVELPFFWGRPSEYADGWGATNGIWKRFEATWDAAPHQGTTRYLGFRGESDSYPVDMDDVTSSSSFLFDSLSFRVFRCVK